MMEQIQIQAKAAVTELIETAKLRSGDMLVIGCSSSEVVGETIGKGSSLEAAQAIYDAVAPVLAKEGIYLVAQCCEHLNRALIMERECAEKYGYDIVSVLPQPHVPGRSRRFALPAGGVLAQTPHSDGCGAMLAAPPRQIQTPSP